MIIAFSISLNIGCHPQISKTDQEKSFSMMKQCHALFQANKLDSAETLIDEALKLYPGNYVAYNNRAYLEILEKKPQQEIINDLNKAIELSPKYDIALISLANYYFLIYDYENTIKISERYLSLQLTRDLDKNMVEHIYAITGISEKHLLQFDNAIIDLKKSLEMDPGDKFSHKELAECYYFGRNDISSAITEFTKALDIDSSYYQAYYGREICYRNSKPPLKEQAVSDSINAEKFDTSHTTESDSTYRKLEKARKSLNIETLRASAYYDTIIALFRPTKMLQQKVIDNITLDLQTIRDNNTATIDTKYLQKITNEAIASNELLVQKINKIQEVDSSINCKRKLLDYENLFRDFMINDIPELLKILNNTQGDRVAKATALLKPPLILVKQKGIEFYDAEEALMDKYSLH